MYWNKIRKDFPEVFEARAKLERLTGYTCLKKKRDNPDAPASIDNSVRLFLDELEPDRGREEDEINEDCGIMCEVMKI